MPKKEHKADRHNARRALDEKLAPIITNKDIIIGRIEYFRDLAVKLKTTWVEEEVDIQDLEELTEQIDYFNALLDV